MGIDRRRAIGFGLLLPLGAHASFPERAVTVVVPTPPGGPIDRVARVMAQAMQATPLQARLNPFPPT